MTLANKNRGVDGSEQDVECGFVLSDWASEYYDDGTMADEEHASKMIGTSNCRPPYSQQT